MEHFKGLKTNSMNRDIPIHLQLPPEPFLMSIASGDLKLLQQQCTYVIPLASQALQHATCLLSIISTPLTQQYAKFDIMSSFQEYIPWLFDAYLNLHDTQVRWQYIFPSVLPFLLENALQFFGAIETTNGFDTCIQQKTFTLLVLLCMEMSSHSLGRLIADEQGNSEYQLLCRSLGKVAKTCLQSEPISRLVTSQLIPALEKPIMGNEVAISGTDLWVSINLILDKDMLILV